MNEYAVIRSNYFKVTSEEKLKEIIRSACTFEFGEDIELFTRGYGDNKEFSFGAYGTPIYCPKSEDLENLIDSENEKDHYLNCFLCKLQDVLPDGENVIMKRISHNGLQAIDGDVHSITNDFIAYKDFEDCQDMFVNNDLRRNFWGKKLI